MDEVKLREQVRSQVETWERARGSAGCVARVARECVETCGRLGNLPIFASRGGFQMIAELCIRNEYQWV
jgi:hypothetical protein